MIIWEFLANEETEGLGPQANRNLYNYHTAQFCPDFIFKVQILVVVKQLTG